MRDMKLYTLKLNSHFYDKIPYKFLFNSKQLCGEYCKKILHLKKLFV